MGRVRLQIFLKLFTASEDILENFMIFIKYLGFFFFFSVERASNLIMCELSSLAVSSFNNVIHKYMPVLNKMA